MTTCTGCRILFTYPGTIDNTAYDGGRPGNRAGKNGGVHFKFTPTIDGGDGKCEFDDEEGCIADEENPCVFKGHIDVHDELAGRGARQDVVVTTCGGTANPETNHRISKIFEKKSGGSTWWTSDASVPIGTILNANTSACEGLVNPIDSASNAYKITLYSEILGAIRGDGTPFPANTRDANGMPIEPSHKEAIAYLYCEPCEDILAEFARLQNPVMVSADLISSQDPI